MQISKTAHEYLSIFVSSTLTIVAIAAICLIALGCQSLPNDAGNSATNRTNSALEDANGAFDAVDGTALAIESGQQDGKSAAKDLHTHARVGKKAVGKAKDGTAALST